MAAERAERKSGAAAGGRSRRGMAERFSSRSAKLAIPAIVAVIAATIGALIGTELGSMLVGGIGTCILLLVGVAVRTSFGGSSARRR